MKNALAHMTFVDVVSFPWLRDEGSGGEIKKSPTVDMDIRRKRRRFPGVRDGVLFCDMFPNRRKVQMVRTVGERYARAEDDLSAATIALINSRFFVDLAILRHS
jgi:hypothetical protein